MERVKLMSSSSYLCKNCKFITLFWEESCKVARPWKNKFCTNKFDFDRIVQEYEQISYDQKHILTKCKSLFTEENISGNFILCLVFNAMDINWNS